MLKALVTEVTQALPARTHDLIYLVKKAHLQPPIEILEFLGKLNSASIPTRYPTDLSRAIQDYPMAVAQEYLRQTIEALAWLKQHPSLSK